MARRVKPKISYKKNKKTPKAFIGAATAAIGLGKSIYGGIQASRANKAEAAFDKSRLETKVSSATKKMADQPIDQNYIEQMQAQQAADRASAMGALSKDPRNALAGVQALEAQAIFYKSELTLVLRSYNRKKFNEIFSLHAKYANSSNILESLSVSRGLSQRKRELALIEIKLELSDINKKISPIVDVKYENIYYYDAKNKLLIPMISISAFFIILIFGLFAGFNRSD